MTSVKLFIIGSGPAGLTAAIYSGRAGLQPILAHGMQPGGQLTLTTDVENYPGFANTVNGPWLIEQMIQQAKNSGANIINNTVEIVDFSEKPFNITLNSGIQYTAESIIISTGAQAKWLGLKSEEYFRGYGVSACATCDGFFFKNQTVLVVGGGNTAVEEAIYLTKYAKNVILIHRKNYLKSEKILQDRLFQNSKISVLFDHQLLDVLGNNNPKTVNGAKIQNLKSGAIDDIKCDGIFIAIGHKPNTEIFRNKIAMDSDGYIITTPGSTKTNISGVFAAGDVQDKIFRQAITAAGTGCMAALEVEEFLNQNL